MPLYKSTKYFPRALSRRLGHGAANAILCSPCLGCFPNLHLSKTLHMSLYLPCVFTEQESKLQQESVRTPNSITLPSLLHFTFAASLSTTS